MSNDIELDALNKANEMLSALPLDARLRVISWINNKFLYASAYSSVAAPAPAPVSAPVAAPAPVAEVVAPAPVKAEQVAVVAEEEVAAAEPAAEATGKKRRGRPKANPDAAPRATSTNLIDYDNLGDLLAAARPRTEQDQVMLAAAFMQINLDNMSITGTEVQQLLRQYKVSINNASKQMKIMSGRAKYMENTGKQGDSKQARKCYKLTDKGLDHVKKCWDNFPNQFFKLSY